MSAAQRRRTPPCHARLADGARTHVYDGPQSGESADLRQLRRYHHIIPPAVTAGRRVLIVGDLHGCYDELQDLLAKCGYRPGQDMVVSVGDLVNKGPKSLAVLRWFADNGPLVRAVRGNHELLALRSYRQMLAGKAPEHPQYSWSSQLDEQLVGYLERMPLTIRLPAYQVIVVHAGLVPGVGLTQQHIVDFTTMVNCAAVRCEHEAEGAGAGASTGGQFAAAFAAASSAGSLAGSLCSSSLGSSSLSSLDVSDFELVASASIRSSSSSGSSSSRAARPKPTVADIRARESPLRWQDALLAYAQQQEQEQEQRQQLSSAHQHSASGGGAAAEQQQLVEPQQGQQLELIGVKKHTVGVRWARAWSQFRQAAPERHAWATFGCEHAVFGHDAQRLLQLERCATGIDGGCVEGNMLYCLLLPPLGEDGQPLLEQGGAPPDALQTQLCGGLPAFVVGVPARHRYVP